VTTRTRAPWHHHDPLPHSKCETEGHFHYKQDHQQVMVTRWCVLLILLALRRPSQPPTSQYNSLVCCSRPPHTSSTTTATNESRWLVSVLLSSLCQLPQPLTSRIDSLVCSCPPHPSSTTTVPRPPASHYDLLVCRPHPLRPLSTANRSQWLVGVSSPSFPPLIHSDYHEHLVGVYCYIIS